MLCRIFRYIELVNLKIKAMKLQKYFPKKVFPLFILVSGCLSVASAQTSTSKQDKAAAKTALIKDMVESQNYVFQAQMAMPSGGRSRQLTTDYDLTVTKASVVSYLPYFGRAYTAPIDPTQGGFQFTSKDFDYTATPGKKGGWDILIKPRDARAVQQMSLHISEEGYANLQVISNSKQPISFNGVVAAPKQKRH
jgi:hypothetical protein